MATAPDLGIPPTITPTAMAATPSISIVAPTTSSFNWWPYPPQGDITTTPSALLISPSPLSTPISDSQSFPPDASLPQSAPMSANSSVFISASSSSSSFSFVVITASHPGPSADVSFPAEVSNKPRTTSSLVYAIPAVAVVAGILGAILANWIVNRWIRKRRRRRDSLGRPENSINQSHPGSRGGIDFDEFVNQRSGVENESMPLTGSHLAVFDVREHHPYNLARTPQSFGPYVHEPVTRSGSWLHRVITKASSSRTRQGNSSLIVPANATRYQLTDNYEKIEKKETDAGVHGSNSRPLLSPYSSRTNDSDREYDNTPAETLRHNSIRRGIVAKIQTGSGLFTGGNISLVQRSFSQKSKESLSSWNTGGSIAGVAGLDSAYFEESNSGNKSIRARDMGHGRSGSDIAIQALAEKTSKDGFLRSSPHSTSRQQGIPRYLEGSREATRHTATGLDGLLAKFAQTDRQSVGSRLPSSPSIDMVKSPPTVWSPSLESELLFSPTSPLSSKNKQLPGLPPHRPPSSSHQHQGSVSLEDDPPRAVLKENKVELPVTRKRTLHGPRTSSRRNKTSSVPTLASHKDVPIPRLPGGPREPVSPTKLRYTGSSPGSPAQRYHARRAAHKTVESILSKRYTSRTNDTP